MEDKKPKLTVKDAAVDFCENTTVHGLLFLTRFNHRWIQLFWSVIVLCGFIGLSVHLWKIVSAYLEYKTTEYSYEHDNGFLFPDVTICNLNGISSSKLINASTDYDEVNYFINRNIHSDNPVLATDLFWALGDHAVEIGHSLEDFVLRCKFEDIPCNITEDFILYPFSSFFNCYIFKIGRSGRKTITQGIAAGLSLTLFLEPLNTSIVKAYDDNAFAGNMNGVRVLLNAPNTLVAAGIMGNDIVPGHATYMAFEVTNRIRLPEPYSTCRGVDSMVLGPDFAYSFTECKNICIHKFVIDKCGCFPTIYKVRKNYTASKIPSCGEDIYKVSDKTMRACQDSVLKDIETRLNYANDCNCQKPCEDTKYSISISHSEFPSENSMVSFWKTILEDNTQQENIKAYKYYEQLRAQNTSMESMIKWTQKHFLRLTVYATSKTVSVKKYIPMITPVGLMSQIGGCLGLWLGISIVTIIEFFDLGFKLFYVLYRKLNNSAKLKNEGSDNTISTTASVRTQEF